MQCNCQQKNGKKTDDDGALSTQHEANDKIEQHEPPKTEIRKDNHILLL